MSPYHPFWSHLWIWLFVFAGVMLYTGVVFFLLPQYAARIGRRQSAHARALLEWLLRLPAPGGEQTKLLVRYQLGLLHFRERRHADAETQFRALLAHPVPPGLEASVRRQLGDSIDAQGRSEEAKAEFARAETVAQRGSDAAALTARGDILKRKHRYLEALAVYESALRSPDARSTSVRTEIMVRMGLAAFDGRRTDLTVEWMEKAIAEGAQGQHLRSAYSMAGVAHGNLGQFAKAIFHTQQAVNLAEAEGEVVQAGRGMAMLVSHVLRQGDIARALTLCEEIERRQWISRTYFFTKADCLEAIGRYEEAYQTLLQARGHTERSGAVIAHYNRRQEGLVNIGLAHNLALQEQPTAAWQELQEAVVVFRGDDKLTSMCDEAAMWLLALLGRREQAEASMAAADRRIEQFSGDRTERLRCLYSLSRTQYALGDHALAAARWQAYLDAGPNPIGQPRAYFFLGDCQERLGDIDGARRAYQQATCVPIADAQEGDSAWPPAPSLAAGHTSGRFVDTHEARLARQRLELVQ